MLLCCLSEVQEVPSLEAFKMRKHYLSAQYRSNSGLHNLWLNFIIPLIPYVWLIHNFLCSEQFRNKTQHNHSSISKTLRFSLLNLIIAALLLQLRTRNINTTTNCMDAQTTHKANDRDIFRGILSTFMSILYVNKYLHKSWTKLSSKFLLYSEEYSSITEDKPLLKPANSLNILWNHTGQKLCWAEGLNTS